MDAKELDRVSQLFHINRKRSGYMLDSRRGDCVAAIATVVDLVREELKKVQPIKPCDTISIFDSPSTMQIYNALYSLGCYELKEITGWRKTMDSTTNRALYQLMVNGRLANLPSSFTDKDKKCLELGLLERGLEFKELL